MEEIAQSSSNLECFPIIVNPLQNIKQSLKEPSEAIPLPAVDECLHRLDTASTIAGFSEEEGSMLFDDTPRKVCTTRRPQKRNKLTREHHLWLKHKHESEKKYREAKLLLYEKKVEQLQIQNELLKRFLTLHDDERVPLGNVTT